MSARGFCAAALVALFVAGCSKGDAAPSAPRADPKAAEHKDEPAHEALPKKVHLGQAVIAAAKIKTAPVAREVLDTALSLPGEIVADPDRSARVASPIAGRIERVAFAEGKAVKARELLAVVRVPDLPDRQAALASASARAGAARANARRLDALAAKGLAAAQEVADAKAQATALEAEARAAAERLRVLDVGPAGKGSLLELRAPIAGLVVTRDAVVGQTVDPDRPIATIADLSEVWFLGRVFENDLAHVRVGARAEVQLNAYPEERFEGEITLLGRQVDPVARTLVARVPLANRRDLLRLGLFGAAPWASRARRSPCWSCSAARSRTSAASRSCSCATPTTTSSCTRSSSGDRRWARSRCCRGCARGRRS
jgi:membrane fusion protein, heavy metal efflux system